MAWGLANNGGTTSTEEVIWANASPGSEFRRQTITLQKDLSKYKQVYIDYLIWATTKTKVDRALMEHNPIPLDGSRVLLSNFLRGSRIGKFYGRYAWITVTNNAYSVEFDELYCIYGSDWGITNPDTPSDHIIPYRIVGVRG